MRVFILQQQKKYIIGEDHLGSHAFGMRLEHNSNFSTFFFIHFGLGAQNTLCYWYAIVRAVKEITKKNYEKLFDRVNS